MKISKQQLYEMVQKETIAALTEICGIKKSKLNKKAKTIKNLNEWVTKDDDIELINSPEDGSKQYVVGLWTGSGYALGEWRVFADEVEPALDFVVAHLEEEGKTEYFCDEDVEAEKERMRSEGKDDKEIDNEIETWALYVDATMEGAQEPHYVRSENLKIREVS